MMTTLIRKLCVSLCLILLAVSLPAAAASLFDPSLVYNSSHVSPLRSYFEHVDEKVDPSSGSLTITQTDFVLPGRNGLDFAFTRRYQSNLSGLGRPDYYYTEQYDAYYEGRFDYLGTEITFYDEGGDYIIKEGFDRYEEYEPQFAVDGIIRGRTIREYWEEDIYGGIYYYGWDEEPAEDTYVIGIIASTVEWDPEYSDKHGFGSGWILDSAAKSRCHR